MCAFVGLTCNTLGYATTNSFYQYNQDATTNTYATTNAETYYRPT